MSGLQGGQYPSVISQMPPFQLFLCPPFVCILKGYDLERQLWRSMAILWLFMSKFVPYKIFNMLTLSSFCRSLSAYWVLFYNFISKLQYFLTTKHVKDFHYFKANKKQSISLFSLLIYLFSIISFVSFVVYYFFVLY